MQSFGLKNAKVVLVIRQSDDSRFGGYDMISSALASRIVAIGIVLALNGNATAIVQTTEPVGETISAEFRGKVVYDGSYEGTRTTPPRMPSNLSLGGLLGAALSSNTEDVQGGTHFEIEYEGNRLKGTWRQQGILSGSGTITGTRNGSVCQIITNEGVKFSAECSQSRFFAKTAFSDARGRKYKGVIEAKATSVVNYVERDQQTAQSASGPSLTKRSEGFVQTDSNSYDAKQFYGVDVWVDAFDKAQNKPAEFKVFIDGMIKSASGAGATVNALATGPKRNFYQKFLTDYQIFSTYFPDKSILLEKSRQCTIPKKYTAAEACDCVAGFPGSTLIGPGAGELVVGSNSKIGIAACGKAAAEAGDPKLKARYTAQRARAQVYTFNTFQAVQWADEAIRMGYSRASIVKASAALRDFEVRNSGFPAPSRQESESILKIGADFLKESKKLGVRETYIIARQYQQALAIYKFNTSLYGALYKSMTTPPPAEQSGGCRADGVPCSGEKYDANGNIVQRY